MAVIMDSQLGELRRQLHPIVIPPLHMTFQKHEFLCSGRGLQCKGFDFEPRVASAPPLLEPARTKKGTIKVHQPYVRPTTQPYWQAQCIFRGLKSTGTSSFLQAQIREALTSGTRGEMLQSIKELENTANADFQQENAKARDEQWKLKATNKARAEADPIRFLRETFLRPQGAYRQS
jgi:hypothetical protein